MSDEPGGGGTTDERTADVRAPDDIVPASVRLGNVVPPEDPEDWTRPLTWVAAGGMLAGPATAFAWFALLAPRSAAEPVFGTWLVAALLAAGAALSGATQVGPIRSLLGTLAAGLFAALVTIVLGAAMAGTRQVGEASPTLAHALGAALAGLAGTLAATGLAPALANRPSRGVRVALPAVVGAATTLLVVPLLFGQR